MSKFDKAFNYYLNLFEYIPEDYSIFGKFGESCWTHEINEGLITSYPRENVIKFLQNIKSREFDITFSKIGDLQTIDIYVEFVEESSSIEPFVKKLNKQLSTYGYFVGQTLPRNSFYQYKLLIEPKYPTLLSDEDKSVAPFYHITYNFYLPKIQKIGLSPRESTTVFSHPGGRIYLIQTKDASILNRLKQQLSNSKIETAKSNGVKNLSKFFTRNMVVLEIEHPNELYRDPMFPKSKNYNAVFTTKNIPPNNIKQTNF
jgi:hypothetical protein